MTFMSKICLTCNPTLRAILVWRKLHCRLGLRLGTAKKFCSIGPRSRKKPNFFFDTDDSRSPAHVPILSASDDLALTSSSATSSSSTKLSSRRVTTTGCCVAIAGNKMSKQRRPLSGSYSALVKKFSFGHVFWPLGFLKLEHFGHWALWN